MIRPLKRNTANFERYIRAKPPDQRELPLVHTTECHNLNSIRSTHSLTPQLCPVFGEPILYFFYGRPSYRNVARTTPIRADAFCPLSFVLRPRRRYAITRIYPFDSGAASKGLYEPEILAHQALQRYSVTTVIDRARQIVRHFFETNENYLGCRPKIGLAFSNAEVDAAAYYKLVNGGGQLDCDDRKSAIEIQMAAPVSLRKDLMAVIMPTHFLDDDNLRKTLIEDWRAHPLTYDVDMGMRPSEFHGNIRAIIREYYKDWKFI